MAADGKTVEEQLGEIVGELPSTIVDRGLDSFVAKFRVDKHGVAGATVIVREGRLSLVEGRLVLGIEVLAKLTEAWPAK